ncbi:MAG: ATP-binding protein [Bacteroidaceae bacterium]|nr:ATP-binding protein [Bacteroidaceae bacterium]
MIKFANRISKIEISSLWGGHKHIVWSLRPDVNVLSGHNGAGKSTILNRLVQHLRAVPASGELVGPPRLGVKIEFDPSDATAIRYDIIRSFDRRLVRSDRLDTLTDMRVNTELDWQLYLLQRRYLDYQVDIANRMIELLSNGDPAAREKAADAAAMKTRFQDLVDELFSETGKHIDRQSNEISFVQYGEPLQPYLLSSGEKQILVVLLTVLTENCRPYVLFMDEPEASLHFEWQKRLITMIRELNPNAQIILTTHSPALIIDGWEDAVTEVRDITV